MERKEPKKARTVQVDLTKTLKYTEFDELLRHARNSSLWYAGRYPSHSSKLKERLYEKGYPKDSVTYENMEGSVEQGNLVDLAISELEMLHMIDDQLYVESKLKSGIAKGKGLHLVARELQYKGIDESEIEAALDLLEDDLTAELEASIQKAAEKAMRSMPYRRAQQGWQKSMVISGVLRSKGFDRDSVDNWMESNAQIFED